MRGDHSLGWYIFYYFYHILFSINLLKPQMGNCLLIVTLLNMKVYPGQRAAGIEADMMAANELNAHAFLQVCFIFNYQKIFKRALVEEFGLGI